MKMTNILKMFDTVSSSEEGSWLHLRVPGTDEKAYADGDKQKKPLRIKLKGPDSDAWTAFARKAAKQESKNKTTHEMALDDAQLMAKMTLGFDNIPDFEFSKDAAIKLYLDYKDIRIQAINHVANRENFIKKPNEV